MIKKISMVLGIVVAFFVVIGGLWKYDQIKADAAEVKVVNDQIQLVASRLDQKIVNDNIRYIQQRIWDIQMYYQKMGQLIPPEVQQQINKMEYDIKMLMQQLGK